MNILLNAYFDKYQFKDFAEVKDHFSRYLNDERYLRVEFDFFGEKVVWTRDIKELSGDFSQYQIKQNENTI